MLYFLLAAHFFLAAFYKGEHFTRRMVREELRQLADMLKDKRAAASGARQ